MLDLIHALHAMRERQGLALTDRILVRLPSGEHDLMPFRERIAAEVLAREIVIDAALERPAIAKAAE